MYSYGVSYCNSGADPLGDSMSSEDLGLKDVGDLKRVRDDIRDPAVSSSADAGGVKGLNGGESEAESTGVGKPVQRSFSAVVANLQRISKREVVVEEIDGEKIGMIPEDVFDDVKPIWSELLIGRFVDTAPNYRVIHKIVNRIWNLAGLKEAKIEVFKVGESTVKFRIKHQETRAKVLKRRMWNIAGIPMTVEKCAPKSEIVDEVISIVPMWVTMNGVPRGLFNEKGLSYLASRVGAPKKLHMDTELCMKFDEAKVLVDVDVNGELPKVQQFQSKKGLKASISYSYPWLPMKCSTRSRWGHSPKLCPQQKVGSDVVDKPSEDVVKVTEAGGGSMVDNREEVVKESVVGRELVTTQRGDMGDGGNKLSLENSVFDNPVFEPSANVPVDELNEKWVTTKSPARRVSNVVSKEIEIGSPSRYQCLEDDHEEGEFRDINFKEKVVDSQMKIQKDVDRDAQEGSSQSVPHIGTTRSTRSKIVHGGRGSGVGRGRGGKKSV